jgi:hypothetical protein
LAAGLWLVAPSALAAAVAFVTDVQGDARIVGGSRVAFLGELQPDTRISLEKGARVILIHIASGTEFTLAGPGEYVVDAAEAKATKGAPPARRVVAARPDPVLISRLAESATASVRMRSASAPKAAARAALLYPRSTRIATLQPTLTWNAEVPAQGFTVALTTSDGKSVWRGTSKSTSVKVGTRLTASTHYTWTLSIGETAIGETSFETLGADAIRKADASRAAAKTFSDRILHAFVLQDVGATDDARQVWAELARERPDLPELAILAK